MQEIPLSFLSLLPLIAHDPEVELKSMVSRFMTRFVKNQNMGIHIIDKPLGGVEDKALVEQSFITFVYILGHHPDFSDEISDLKMFSV